MLLLGKKGARNIQGIQVFPDHEDPNQYWYLSGPVRLSQKEGNSVFTLIKYNKNVNDEGAKGGGFVTFEVNVGLPEDIEQEIRQQLPPEAKLAAVPFNKGSVKCVALDVGEEQMLGASSPTLYGENSAIFSLTLNEDQTAILEQSFEQAGQPIGVYYDLEFTAMNPALDVKIEADLLRIYKEFQATLGFEGVTPKLPVAIDSSLELGFQRLVQSGVIKMEVITFIDDEDINRQKDEALKLFIDVLLKDWFTPTLELPQVTEEEDREDFAIDNPTQNEDADSSQDSENKASEKEEDGSLSEGIGEDAEDIAGAVKKISQVNIPKLKLKFRYVEQKENKKLSYRFSGAQTTLRSYYPQGFFNRLLSDVEKGVGVVTADMNDLFFKTVDIAVESPKITYEKYGLQSVHFAAKYPGRQVESLIFDDGERDDKTISFPINKDLDLLYERQIQYNFLPDSDWDSELMSWEVPWEITEDRTQVLTPHTQLEFLDINASLEPNFEWGRIQEVQLNLSYQNADKSWEKSKVLRFTADGEKEQHWKLRLKKTTKNTEYTYYFKYFLMDGSSLPPTERKTTSVSGIAVPDLTQDKLAVKVIPLLDSKIDNRVYVDIYYSDSENNYEWEQTLEFSADDTEAIDLSIPLMDTSVDEFEYTLTFVRADNKIYTKPFPKKKYSRILLESEDTSELTIEVIPEEVNWDDVRLVSLELLYQDEQNDIHETVSQTFKEYDQPFEWKLEIADKSITHYSWRASFYMRDSSLGMGGRVDYPSPPDPWQTETSKFLFLDKYQPKEEKLKVEFLGDYLDWEEVEKVKIWLRYEDEANDIDERETVTLDEDKADYGWQVKLADATHQEYRWKAKYYLGNNKSKRTSWKTDTAREIDLEASLASVLD